MKQFLLLRPMRMGLVLAFLLFTVHVADAQAYRLIAPPAPASYNAIINLPGATLQQVVDTLYAHINPADTGEGGGFDRLNDFQTFWQGRAVANDSSGFNMFQQYTYAMRQAVLTGQTSPCPGDGNWAPIGPDSLPLQADGYVNAVWADPDDSNTILAGTIYSGLWKTTDGGKNWVCITDNAPLAYGVMGVNRITVNPINKNTIYLGTLGGSILKSFDGGNTWQQEFIKVAGDYSDTVQSVPCVFMTPDTTRLYAFVNDSVYTRSNGNPIGAWQNITPFVNHFSNYDPATTWFNLVFLPGDQTHFFICNAGSDHQWAAVWESDVAVPSTSDWTKISTGLTATLTLSGYPPVAVHDTDFAAMDIAAPGDDTLYMIGMDNIADYYAGLWKYCISTQQWFFINSSLPNGGNPTWTHFNLVVSSAGTSNNLGLRNIYYGCAIPYQSYDGGHSFQPIGRYWSDPTHADIRSIYLQSPTNTAHGSGDRVFLGTDGGVSVKYAGYDVTLKGDSTTVDISGKGLDCGTFNGFAISEGRDLGLGGMMHDGIVSYEPTLNPAWVHLVSADAWTAACDGSKADNGYTYYGEGIGGISLAQIVPSGGRLLGKDTGDVNPIPDDANFIAVGPPIETDNGGNSYVVQNNFWEKPPGGDFHERPDFGFPTGATADTMAGAHIALNPNDTTFEGYVLYFHNSGQSIYYRNPTISKTIVFKASDVPGSVGFYSVTNIATNPGNTQQVWVTQGNIDYLDADYTQYRVAYSADHGQDWVDISTGLPQRIPATCIVYDQGTNMLYCSTDAGIYRCDFSTYTTDSNKSGWGGHTVNNSVAWTCFNNGKYAGHNFPNVTVNNLLINHCENKLYASTYGRSVWATDLASPYDIVASGDTITTNTTWTSNQYIDGAIVVSTGYTLTFSGDTVHMPRNGAIIVQPGAKLVVNHALITNDCASCMWYGIEALGDSSLPQTPANQADVVIENGSVLQHARYAVSNYDTWNGTPSSAGGIVAASNSNFINNHCSVIFTAYHNRNLFGTHINNLSSFANDSFLVDSIYKGYDTTNFNYPFANHVHLENVEGIAFKGCIFLNRTPLAGGAGGGGSASAGRGDGIYAYNAGFSVRNGCPPAGGFISCIAPAVPSQFIGFTNGIYIAGDISLAPTAGIQQAYFDSNSVGVSVSAMNNVSVTNCDFHIGNGLYVYDAPTWGDCQQNIGILTQNSQQFTITGDSLVGFANDTYPDWANIGVAVLNSGGNDKTVNANIFTGLQVGCYAYGANGVGPLGGNLSPAHFTGLHILCNAFSYNTVDIQVDTSATAQGIGPFQGSYSGSAAGNTFYPSGVFTNNGYGIDYYYDQTVDYTLPTFYGVVLADPISATSCPSGGGVNIYASSAASSVMLSNADLASDKAGFYTAKTTINDSTVIYNRLIDLGNTDSVLSVIAAARVASQLGFLALASPWLSAAVVYATVTDTLLSPHMDTTLLARNPQAVRDMELNPVYSTYFKSGLYTGSFSDIPGIARRYALESSLLDATAQLSDYSNSILTAMKVAIDTNVSLNDTTGMGLCTDTASVYYGLDSNTAFVNLDSVGVWLQNLPGLWAQYALAGYYNYIGDKTDLSALMTSIGRNGADGKWSDYDSTDNANYNTILGILAGVSSDGRLIDSLNPTETATLDGIGMPPSPLFTPNIAWNITGPPIPFHPNPCLITNLTGDKQPQNNGSNNNQAATPYSASPFGQANPVASLTAYPNPAGNNVIFTYTLPGPCSGNCEIVITDIIGKPVQTLPVGPSASGKIVWDTHNIVSGVYLYKLTGTPISAAGATGKLVIEK